MPWTRCLATELGAPSLQQQHFYWRALIQTDEGLKECSPTLRSHWVWDNLCTWWSSRTQRAGSPELAHSISQLANHDRSHRDQTPSSGWSGDGSPAMSFFSLKTIKTPKKFYYRPRGSKYTQKNYTKTYLNDPDNRDGIITHLEPDILECEVRWALGSINMNKASGGDGIQAELFQVLKDDALKVLHSICHQMWKIQQWPQD